MAHTFIPDIDSNVRKSMIALLNHRLADALDLKLAVKQAHWNIKGKTFIALHLLLDDVAGRVDENADTMAERIVQIGGTAKGTSQAVAKATSLPAYPLDITAQDDHVTALCERMFSFGNACRKDIEEADKAGDADTADILTQVSRAIDKDIWFLRSHLE
ncbi:DNA starvation/stationary phase protection protein Dps [Aestuariivirga sp.]|uniref:DNA starvation/stationary phase protection protein Dps n=1 Tax=Aestuariivirga sp. TaxID=2650926 RepID=UPI0039E243FD